MKIFFGSLWIRLIVRYLLLKLFFGDEGKRGGGGKNAAGVHGGRDEGWGAGLMPRAQWLFGCNDIAAYKTNGANGVNGFDGRDGRM